MTERKGRFGWKGLVALTMISGALVFGGVVGCAIGRGNYTNINEGEPAMSTAYKKSKLMRNLMDVMPGAFSKKVQEDMENYNKRENVSRLPGSVYKDSGGGYSPPEGYGWVNPSNPNDLRVAPLEELR